MAAVFGTDGTDVLSARAPGADILVGGDGADWFLFSHNIDNQGRGGFDVVADFEAGLDHIALVNVSPKTVTARDSSEGVLLDFGGFATRSEVLFDNVHDVGAVLHSLVFL